MIKTAQREQALSECKPDVSVTSIVDEKSSEAAGIVCGRNRVLIAEGLVETETFVIGSTEIDVMPPGRFPTVVAI